jgi:hypothetical protein
VAQQPFRSQGSRWGWVVLLALALLVRLPGLAWQPLWWDEGYSVYFATEPLGRMLALTAADIHPPLYYALLAGWVALVQGVQPVSLRLFSVGSGVVAVALLLVLAHTLYPQRRRVVWLGAFLLAVHPLHLYYSQEVRMYGLGLVLGLVTTLLFWQLCRRIEEKRPTGLALIAYGLAAVLALYTLYYLALLLLAHALWAVWWWRHSPRRLLPIFAAYGLAFVLYLPWLLYAVPKLLIYVADKVPSDADEPLGALAYLVRHLLAFGAGHLQPGLPVVDGLRWLGVLTAVSLLVVLWRVKAPASPTASPATSLLLVCMVAPAVAAFALNLRLPFFPTGGERLLLFVLPYFLLLLADGIDRLWPRGWVGPLALVGLLLAAVAGLWTFYTLPRYTEDDYRPLIRHIVQGSATDDTVLAIFPWQVGYWRSYSALFACQSDQRACTLRRGIDDLAGPRIMLLDDRSVHWGPGVIALIDQALSQGTLWFPAPLSFGSTLPGEIEQHLAQQTVNVENRWFSATTRLSAWRRLADPPLQTLAVDFGRVRLTGAGVGASGAASSNEPVAVALLWQGDEMDDLGATIRLVDDAGFAWAGRTYFPLGSFNFRDPNRSTFDQVGFMVPTGLPPGDYSILVGVVLSETQQLVPPLLNGAPGNLAPVARLAVTAPAEPQPPYRLPIQHALSPPVEMDGLALLGHAGATGERLLAGEPLQVTLFWQAQQTGHLDRLLFVQLRTGNGATVAGWEGWSPSAWPLASWPAGALAQAPVNFDTPATLAEGEYDVVAGFAPDAEGEQGSVVALGQVNVYRRPVVLEPPAIPQLLAEPVQFGAHVLLLGYDQERRGDELLLTLYWQVRQTLLPPHHLFVHLDGADGVTLVQDDGPPLTASGLAPTGSWLPDEYLVTFHRLAPLPDDDDGVLRVGLYAPEMAVRLPASVAGQPSGDAARLPLAVTR